jgi:beta-xylosidase
VRRGSILSICFVLLALVLVACRPVKDPAPPAPPPPPALPAAPGGASATPALAVSGNGPDRPLGAPDPDVISVDPSWCASIPPPTTTTTTSTTATSTTTTTSSTTTTTTTPAPGPTGCYYEYSTPTIVFAPTAVPVWRSTDLVHWYPAGPLDPHNGNQPTGIAFGGGTSDGMPADAVFPLWAPSVVRTAANRFVMWFSEKSASVGQMCIWSAVASAPDGPFSYGHGPYCNPGRGGIIDPDVFTDTDGTAYLTYKGEGTTAPYIPTRIYEARLPSSSDSLVDGSENQLLEVLPAPSNEYPIVEAPTMVRSPGGTLFLLYSAYNWYTTDYKINVARCDNPWGPCNRLYSTPLLGSRGTMLGPGGQTPFKDAAGNWQLAFHAWDAAGLATNPIDGSLRYLRVLPLAFPNGNPQVG